MEPLKSSKIPAVPAEQAADRPVLSCKEWGDHVIRGYYRNNVQWKGGSR